MNDQAVIDALREAGKLAEAWWIVLERACAEDEGFETLCRGVRHPREERMVTMRVEVAHASATCPLCGTWNLLELVDEIHPPGIARTEIRTAIANLVSPQAQEIAQQRPTVDETGGDVPAAPAPAETRIGYGEALGDEAEELADIELAVLGASLQDAQAAAFALDHVRIEHFTRPDLKRVWRALQRCTPEGATPDLLLVREDLHVNGELQLGDTDLLAKSQRAVPTASNQRLYVQALLRRWVAREERAAHAAGVDAQGASGRERALQRIARARELLAKTTESPTEDRGEAWDFSALMQTQFPPPNLLWQDWLTGPSVNIAFGPSGAGKSWLVWALALGLALPIQGELLTKDLREKAVPALLVLGSEDPPRRAQDRLGKLLRSGPIPGVAYDDVPLTVRRPPPQVGGLQTPAGMKWLQRAISERKARFLALDTIGSLLTMNLSKGEEVMPWLRFLHRLRDEEGLTIVMNAHTRKASSDAKKNGTLTSIDDLFGAQEWRAQTDGLVMFAPETDDEERTWISRVKDKDLGGEAPRVLVKLDRESGRFEVLAGADKPAKRDDVPRSGGHDSNGRGRPLKVSVPIVREMLEQLQRIPANDIPRQLGVSKHHWWNVIREIRSELIQQGVLVVVNDPAKGYVWLWKSDTPSTQETLS